MPPQAPVAAPGARGRAALRRQWDAWPSASRRDRSSVDERLIIGLELVVSTNPTPTI